MTNPIPLMTGPTSGTPGPEPSAAAPDRMTADVTPGSPDGSGPAPPAGIRFEDLTLPEGFAPDHASSRAFLDLINNAELSAKDRSQGLLNLHRSEVQQFENSYAENRRKAWGEHVQRWTENFRNDQEIGGNRMETNMLRAGRVIENLLPPDEADTLINLLDHFGVGTFPPFVRMLVRWADRVKFAPEGITKTNPVPPKPERGLGNRGWYGDMGEGE